MQALLAVLSVSVYPCCPVSWSNQSAALATCFSMCKMCPFLPLRGFQSLGINSLIFPNISKEWLQITLQNVNQSNWCILPVGDFCILHALPPFSFYLYILNINFLLMRLEERKPQHMDVMFTCSHRMGLGIWLKRFQPNSKNSMHVL